MSVIIQLYVPHFNSTHKNHIIQLLITDGKNGIVLLLQNCLLCATKLDQKITAIVIAFIIFILSEQKTKRICVGKLP